MLLFTPSARLILKLINLSCPMTKKDNLALYQKENLDLEEIRPILPLTFATIYSALQPEDKEITPRVLVRAFSSEKHLSQTNQRFKSGLVYLKGRIYPFIEFMKEKNIHLDSPENVAALTLFDTLTLAQVVNLSDSQKAKLNLSGITVFNAVIPKVWKSQIQKGESVFVHFGAVISPVTPGLEKTAQEILKLHQKSPLFQKALKLCPKEIDCLNFCPSLEKQGMNLTHYLEAQM